MGQIGSKSGSRWFDVDTIGEIRRSKRKRRKIEEGARGWRLSWSAVVAACLDSIGPGRRGGDAKRGERNEKENVRERERRNERD